MQEDEGGDFYLPSSKLLSKKRDQDGISGDRFPRPSPRIEFEKKTIIENKGKGMIDRNILRISRDGIDERRVRLCTMIAIIEIQNFC